MHILLGTIVGASFAAATVVLFAVARGKTPVAKHVLLAALGGAVAGAVTTATLGAGGTAAAGIGHEVVAFAVGGGSGGAVERLAENAIDGQALGEGVASSAAFGAGVGVLSLGAAKGFQAGAARFVPKRWQSTGPPKTFLQKLMAAKTTGTGGSWLRGARAPGTGRGVRRAIDGEEEEIAPAPGEITTGDPSSRASRPAISSSPARTTTTSAKPWRTRSTVLPWAAQRPPASLGGTERDQPSPSQHAPAAPSRQRGGLTQALLGR